MTDTDELEHILTGLINYTAKVRNRPVMYPDAGLLDIHAAKAAILAWHTKQLKQAEHAAEVRGRIDEVERIPNPAIIGLNGIRKEPILAYKSERTAQLKASMGDYENTLD